MPAFVPPTAGDLFGAGWDWQEGDGVNREQAPAEPGLVLPQPALLVSEVVLLVWGAWEIEEEEEELESGIDWVWARAFFPLKFSKTQDPYVGFHRFFVLFFSFWLPEEEPFLEQGGWSGGSWWMTWPPANALVNDRQGAGTGSAQDGSRASRYDITWVGWVLWWSRWGLMGCRRWGAGPRLRGERLSWEEESWETACDISNGVRLLEVWSDGRINLPPSSSAVGAYSTGSDVLITSGSLKWGFRGTIIREKNVAYRGANTSDMLSKTYLRAVVNPLQDCRKVWSMFGTVLPTLGHDPIATK